MGKASRDKGKRGEREIASLCQEFGYDVHRTAQFRGNTGAAGDCEGLPHIHIEVKRTEAFRLWDALAQAKHDAAENGKGNIPTVWHRKNDCPWVVILEAKDFLKIYRSSDWGER